MRTLVAARKVANVAGFAADIKSSRITDAIRQDAASIIARVRRRGDAAVLDYEKKFGDARPAHLRVTPAQIRAARSRVSRKEIAAIRTVARRLAAAENATKRTLRPTQLREGGMRVRREFVPISSVGCYVPGASARYPSSAVMSIVPARIAGVKRIAVASPPGPDGRVDPLTLTAADMCGATEIYCMGGAHAIAALAYGTRTVKRVDKIVGPGGAYIEAAKLIVSQTVGIDMTAGPTELGIVADSSASPHHIALDMISQSEHGVHSACFMATDSARLAAAVSANLDALCAASPRSGIVRKSLSKNAFLAVCRSRREAIELVDLLAPEHVQVMTRNPARDARLVRNAGLLLLGATPSSASDYVLGSNHILPTRRGGRIRGPLSVLDFVKMRATAEASTGELRRMMPHIDTLANAEGLVGHAEAVRARL